MIHGEDSNRQILLSSLVRYQVSCNEMDDEDLMKLLSFCQGLKAIEINKVNRLSMQVILNSFTNLIHFSLEASKVGPQAGQYIKQLIQRTAFLQTLNLKNCILRDEGSLEVAQGLITSRICNINMSWNDMGIISIEAICRLIKENLFFRIVDLSRNLGPRDVKRGQILVNEIRSTRSIDIKVV